MEAILIFLSKSIISVSLLYLIYWFFLRKDTNFRLNRFYLIASVFVSFIIPFLSINLNTSSSNSNVSILLDTLTVTTRKINSVYSSYSSLTNILLAIYLTGVFIFLCRFLFNLFQLYRIIKRYNVSNREGFNIVFTDARIAPFSFFKWIFIDNSIRTDDAERILKHELIHVRQKHSIDVIIMELLIVFQWFNPIAWIYRHSITEVHEFLADEGAVKKGIEIHMYQQLLLSMAMGVCTSELSNNFNYSLIKKRIFMMTRKKSGKYTSLKGFVAIPVLALTIIIFACNKENVAESNIAMPDKNAKALTEQKTLNDSNTKEEFKEIGKQPEFKGGQEAMIKYLMNEVKYPVKAKNQGIQGKVFVSFDVTETGKVTNVKVEKSVNPDLDAEALRVISSMPDWNPGENDGTKVTAKMSLPINFKLQ